MKIVSQTKSAQLKLKMGTVFSQRTGLSYSRFNFMKHDVGVSFDTYATLVGARSYE